MLLFLSILLFASLIMTFMYVISTVLKAWAGVSFIGNLIMALLFFSVDMIIADALNII